MTEDIVILRTDKYALNPWGPTIDCVAGESYPFPLSTAKELIDAGRAKRFVPPFVIDETLNRKDLRKQALEYFGVDPDTSGKKALATVIETIQIWIKERG